MYYESVVGNDVIDFINKHYKEMYVVFDDIDLRFTTATTEDELDKIKTDFYDKMYDALRPLDFLYEYYGDDLTKFEKQYISDKKEECKNYNYFQHIEAHVLNLIKMDSESLKVENNWIAILLYNARQKDEESIRLWNKLFSNHPLLTIE